MSTDIHVIFNSQQYDKLGRLIKDFEPFKNMWLTASDWQKWYDSWMNDPLTTIDAEQLEQNVNNAFKTVFKCVKHFKEIPACQEVAMEVKEKIENFKPYIPLIQGLRNPGMRSRHWEQVRFLNFFVKRVVNKFSSESLTLHKIEWQAC